MGSQQWRPRNDKRDTSMRTKHVQMLRPVILEGIASRAAMGVASMD